MDVRAGDCAWADHCARFALGRRSSADARAADEAARMTADPYSLRYLVQHLASARRWAQLRDALLDFDFWQQVFQAGSLEFALVEDVVGAERRLRAAGDDGGGREELAALADVLRWLLADGRSMRQEPRAVLQCALAAPLASAVSAAARAFYRQPPLRLANPPQAWPAEVMVVDAPGRRLVRSVCCGPDGELVVSSSGPDAHIRWASTGQLVAPLVGHSRDVTMCAWSSDGLLIATSSEDATVCVWDALTGHLNHTLRAHKGAVAACTFAADGRRLLTSSYDGTLRLFDILCGAQIGVVAGSEGGVAFTCGAIAPDGASVAGTRVDNSVAVFTIVEGGAEAGAAGELLWTHTGKHTDRVVMCAYKPDGAHIVSCSWDTTLVLWDAATGEALWTLRGHAFAVKGCCFSASGALILSASDDFSVKVWRLSDQREVATLLGHSDRVCCAAVGIDGARAYSGSRDGTLRCGAHEEDFRRSPC